MARTSKGYRDSIRLSWMFVRYGVEGFRIQRDYKFLFWWDYVQICRDLKEE